MTEPPLHILLIEDVPAGAVLLRQALADELKVPFTVEHVERLSAALPLLLRGRIDVVLLDLMLPDSEGLETLIQVRARAPQVPVVVLTAATDRSLAIQSLHRGAKDYLRKDEVHLSPNLLGRSLRYAIERQRTEDKLQSAQSQTDQLLASIPSILVGMSADGCVTHWNAVAEATFGLSAAEVLNRSLTDCAIRWDTAGILRCITECQRTNEPVAVDDLAFTRVDGQPGVLGITVIPVRGDDVLLFGADVTERKRTETERSRLQDQLLQSQKMETIGRFAGGIAHDFNNFLQVILGFAWLIRSRHREDRELMSDFQEIVHAAESASAMVRQLLAFSRRQPLKPQVLDINRVIQRMERLLQQFVGERIRVVLQLEPAALPLKLDSTGLEQILMNLCSNARDSMPQGGVVTIRTERRLLDAALLRSHPRAATGAYVQLSVTDTGTGMDPALAAHVFEPFFTTKQVDRGTGLGMAVVYGLVQQHDGLIEIETAPGQGTTFRLYFPLGEVTEVLANGEGGPSRGTESVLLVEGDARQRALDEEVLRESGYRVAAASDGAEGIEELTHRTESVDAVILDTDLTALDGEQVATRLRADHPRAKLLLLSGFVDDQLRALEASLGHVLILQKPYVPAYLLDQLRALLDEPRAAEPSAPAAQAVHRGRVLVVDDEAAVRSLCERILRTDYEVTAVPSGAEALQVLKQRPYDVLLTDVKMPQMDGYTLIEEAKTLQPKISAVIMTGFLAGEAEQRWRSSPPSEHVLRKPFTPPAVQEVIARVLSST